LIEFGLGAAGLASGALSPARTRTAIPSDLTNLSLREAGVALRRHSVSPADLTRACLERIDALNPALNAFITVTAEQALAEARERESEIARRRWRGPLHGIPVALKDNIDTAGIRTTAAAAAFAGRAPGADAEVTRRLREAGAILLGKLNMDECAYGTSSATGHFGAVHNPWAHDYIAGGSSGGPAAAVAARLCYGALGTDTGGSIRQPAAYCGITGLKPTYGLVSARGVIPLSWSLDHVGPMCRSAADAGLMLEAIAGFDAGDPASASQAPADYEHALEANTRKLRLGRPREIFYEGLDPEIGAAVDAALKVLGELGDGVREVALPKPPALAVIFVDASAYLAPALKESPEGFSPAVRQLIEMGGKISAPSYAEARRQLDLARHGILQAFGDVDLIVTPTTPNMPVTIEASLVPSEQRGPPLTARNTTPFNVWGLPTVSICCGFSRSGLPIGLQISGPPFGEAPVLALAHAYQSRTDWHLRVPPGAPLLDRS
jgi:aspartyl-tRNA(Asn)/glutamyl-tRNA(Gln) amidotransferase subunit A